MKIKLSRSPETGQRHRRSAEGTSVLKIVGAGVTGTASYVAAVFTTVVESGGFWQYFCLGACILFFVCAVALVIMSAREGLRIDHTGLSFEPHDRSPVTEQKARIGDNDRVM